MENLSEVSLLAAVPALGSGEHAIQLESCARSCVKPCLREQRIGTLPPMIDSQILNKGGILLQVLAAAYIVFQAWRTARALSGMKITIDSLEGDIHALGGEMKGQFKHQLFGFVVLALGAVAQLSA